MVRIQGNRTLPSFDVSERKCNTSPLCFTNNVIVIDFLSFYFPYKTNNINLELRKIKFCPTDNGTYCVRKG